MAAKKASSGNTGKIKTTTEGLLTRQDRATMKKRAAARKGDKKQDLRDKISGIKLLQSIEKRVGELLELSEGVKKAKDTKTDPYNIGTVISKANARAAIINKAIDTNFRLLAKKLPDLRSVEITDGEGNNIFSAFHDAVLKNQGDK